MNKPYSAMTKDELAGEKQSLEAVFAAFKAKGMSLNMARGKPDPAQCDLSMPLLNGLDGCIVQRSVDCRNYGELTGINEAKTLFAQYMGCGIDEIIIAGSSSLALMYDCLSRALLTGVLGSEKPWGKEEKIKFLCPVPGYDRHFSICQFLGIEMINIPTSQEGPDMAMVEQLVAQDASIKGIWIVPKFSNPLGITYSDEIIKRLASLKPAAKDFRIFCDNAYAMHEVYRDTPLLNLLEACKEAGNPNLVYMFGSTSKVTFPGAGVVFLAASKENIDFTAKQLFYQTIGWDKLNMLRHVRFLKDMDGIRALMKKHAAILRPKFDVVLNKLQDNLAGAGVGSWIKPDGGYFVTFFAEKGCAKRIISLCKEAGVIMTEAGATHPYGNDPDDSCIRIAPTFPVLDELNTAMDVFCVAVKLAAIDVLLSSS